MNSIGQSVFDLESGNGKFDRQSDKKRTNERMELHQFRKEPSYDGDLPPCHLVSSLNSTESVFELESGSGNVDGQKQTDGITPLSNGT